jgi:hypothetical protein
MEFNDNQHFVSRCPFCSAEYDLDGSKVIAEEEESTMVYVTCTDCESSIIAIVAMSGLGIVSLGLVTDMTEADTKRMIKDGAVSSNELLSMYEMLNKNSDAFQDLTGSRK